MTDAQSQLLQELKNVQFNATQSDSLKERGKEWLFENMQQIIDALTQPPEVSEDDLLDAIIETFYGGSKIEGMGDAILRHNLTSRVRVFRANFSISRRVGG